MIVSSRLEKDNAKLMKEFKSESAVKDFKKDQFEIGKRVMELAGGRMTALKPSDVKFYIGSPKIFSKIFLKQNPSLYAD
jgi:hypothetical protein